MVKEAKGRHTALVVEDDPEMAEELRDLLRSLGHDTVSVPSQEEAMGLLDTGKFCFVLLDLQIKTAPDSIKARVEAGKTLLRKVRELFPARNQDDHHHLQILVMSGYAKEMPDVIQCLQDGADDFIIKPLSGNNPSLTAKIEESLHKSKRASHAECPGVMDLARRECAPNGSSTAIPPPGVQLSISGESQGKRTGIVIGGKASFLPDAQFLLLMRLVAGRVRDGQGWVHKVDLGSSDAEGFKGMSNLASAIQSLLPEGFAFYENDKKGSYRIHPVIVVGKIDHDRLGQHSSREVRKLSSEIMAIR
ncbi:MAG: response regulator [Magnetococcales bacterium]|nr:response regulator [Magnetococcales bacterium]